MQKAIYLCALAIGFTGLAPASAQSGAMPDPAAIKVPDLSGSGADEVIKNGWKYFFFRKDGVSFTEAHSDFTDCARFLAPTGWSNVMLPRFIPWDSQTGKKSVYTDSQYGLVGALMASMVEGTLARRDHQAKQRLCMEPRGYIRYGVAEEIWENITGLPSSEAIAIQAKIASGPDFGGKVPVK